MKKRAWLGAVVFVVVVGSCMNSGNNDATTDPAPTGQPVAAGQNPTPAEPVAAPPEPVGEVVSVARVIDGRTFELVDGRTVRALGIDPCRPGTYGGDEAKRMAESDLTNPGNQPITLSQEPGTDTDRDGRLLRYVTMDREYDFGESMVKYDHTGVDQDENGASPAYIQRLYAADLEYAMNPPSGRECADPYAEYRNDVDIDVNDDDDYNMPDGALTGGYCARKWWC